MICLRRANALRSSRHLCCYAGYHLYASCWVRYRYRRRCSMIQSSWVHSVMIPRSCRYLRATEGAEGGGLRCWKDLQRYAKSRIVFDSAAGSVSELVAVFVDSHFVAAESSTSLPPLPLSQGVRSLVEFSACARMGKRAVVWVTSMRHQ